MGRRKDYMDDGDDSSDEESGRINFDITEDDLEAEMAGFAGLGQRKRHHRNDDESSDEDDMPQRGGLGMSGLGPSFQPATPQKKETPTTPIPTEETQPKSRLKKPASAAAPPPGPGFGKFNAHSKGFGQKMLEKMGWKGKGLGADGAGIVNPVETKLRPARMGLSFRGFDERTEQAKYEDKLRKGEISSEEEVEETPKRRNAWKKTKEPAMTTSHNRKSRKPKTVYKTAAEIIADTEKDGIPSTQEHQQQKIIDMTGPTIREISMADIKRTDSPTLMEVTTRLPELRHNLRLIVDLARHDLENLSREKKSTAFRMQSMQDELSTIKQFLDKEQAQLRRLEELKEIARQLEKSSQVGLATGAFQKGDITALFGEQFDLLERDFSTDIKELEIDTLVISVWAPVWKYSSMTWQVLQDPTWGLHDVKRWKRLLTTNETEETASWSSRSKAQVKLVCTPFETMMNTIWLSKVRSAINNGWDIYEPDPMIQLMEEWEPVLPRFIYENIIQQLILPKIHRAVTDWNPRTDPIMIHTWVHPWFPTLRAWRLSELFTTIRHKLSVVLRQWHPSDESALHIISPWKDVWTPDQFEGFVLKSILPKLTLVLRNEFEVNPRDQQHMEVMMWCLAWKDLISETVFGQLLQHEFFTKWHAVLDQWLHLDIEQVNYDEISQWYRWWRQFFDSYGFDTNKIVMQEFRKALEMMNKAIGGGDE
ncbi:hypothetical protein INT47_011634, partial [Mucor saturninus]